MKYIIKSLVLTFLIVLNLVSLIALLILSIKTKDSINFSFFELKSKCNCRTEKVFIYEYNEDYENTNCDLFNVIRRGYGQKNSFLLIVWYKSIIL